MENADLIASIMIVLAPVFVLIGAFVFFCKNKALWDAEIAELSKKHREEKVSENV